MIEPTRDDVGRTVVYDRKPDTMETGVITSLAHDKRQVFVRYEGDRHSKLTMCRDLHWITDRATPA